MLALAPEVDMDTDVAAMFADLREDIGRLAATMDRVETQTTKTNGRVDALEKDKDTAAGAEQQRQKASTQRYAYMTLTGVFGGGILAAIVAKLLGAG